MRVKGVAAALAACLLLATPLVDAQLFNQRCSSDEYKCDDGQCVESTKLCNRVWECSAGEDERNCPCTFEEFQCGDACIERSKLCDGHYDCNNGADEVNCLTNTDCTTFCGDGTCVPDEQVCDGKQDCADGFDERPENCVCSSDDFRCSDGECILSSLYCNGYIDCRDESDERNCTTTSTASPDTCAENMFQCADRQCINDIFRCDHHVDCYDGTDEIGCPPETTDCREGEWRCLSGECIDERQRCDGYNDCTDSSDELPPTCPIEPRPQPPGRQTPPPPPVTKYPDYGRISPETPATPRTETIYTDAPPVPPRDQYTTSSPENQPDQGLNLKAYDPQQQVKGGDDVVFRCRDEGSTRARVVWSREGGRPLPMGYLDNGEGRLELYNVKREDSGSYVCRAVGFDRYYPKAEISVHLSVNSMRSSSPAIGPSQCRDDQATCSNGQCIPRSAICDGFYNCTDGSDESSCANNNVCEPNQFRCNNRQCVLKSWVCDSESDCLDGSDEQGCARAEPGAPCQSNEFTCASRQCIPKSFHCDDYNDCLDGSDEVGCSKVYISQPPPRSKFLSPGDTMVLTCHSVGQPTPEVIWRLNWGHIPPKCRYTSVGGLGTLTCPNVQPEDQGAYSCEAINNKGSVFAVPDTILTVNFTQPDVCPLGYFNSEARLPQDCISCFCFGVSTRCESADLFTFQLPTPLGEGGTLLVGLVQQPTGELTNSDQPIYDLFYYQPSFRNGATVTKLVDSTPRDVYPYLTLPESYNGIQLTSYGGYIKYNLRPHNQRPVYSRLPDIVIKGKYSTLVHHTPYIDSPRPVISVEARLLPQYWSKISTSGIVQATREDIMMALDNVERILIRAEVNGGGVNITDFSMDSAQRANAGRGAANFVEECECPVGYTGLSCQKCDEGYERESSGPWLGHCRQRDEKCPPGYYGEPRRGIACAPCPCPSTSETNRFASTCHLAADGQVTCDCNPGYEGRRCERCAPGLVGNPLQPGDSCRQPAPSRCNPDGTQFEDRGFCNCKDRVEGQYCNQCKSDSFYLSSDNPHGCAQCFCMGVTSKCGSSSLRRRTISSRFSSPQQSPVTIYRVPGTSSRYTDPKKTELQPRVYGGELVLRDFDRSQPSTYYWSLPDGFNGDKVKSYGGYLTYTVRHQPTPGPQGSRNNAADVILISSNGLSFNFFGNFNPSSDGYVNGSVQFLESYWKRSDGNNLQRSDLLMALADVESLLVKASYGGGTAEAALVSASIDTAEEGGSGPRALHVEQCRCPREYVGTSCEDCAPGYTRGAVGIYLEACVPCDCNGHSTQCHPETGVCSACEDNSEGDHCEECLPGYVRAGDDCVADTTEPGPEPLDCRCDQRGEASPCYNGQCQCKANVLGDSCNRCRPGTFNLASSNREGCISCYCSGVTSNCQAASYYSRIPIPVVAISEEHGFTLTTINADKVINDNIILYQQSNQLGYVFGTYPPRDQLFWSLPTLPGNRITSYGGRLMLTQKFESGSYPESSNPAMNIVLVGNDFTIFWTNNQITRSGESLAYEVLLKEDGWSDLATSRPVSRDQFLSVLSELRRVLVLATLSPRVTSTYISDISMDTAIPTRGDVGNADDVELCQCPTGYVGTSCEQCDSGYYRDANNQCVECPCNGRADSCQLAPNSDVVICNCKAPYNGRDCSAVGEAQTNQTGPWRPPPRPDGGTLSVQITKPMIEIVALGSTVNFTCTARSRQRAGRLDVNWSKYSGELPRDRTMEDKRTGLLIITNVQVSDSGTYICQASDGISVSRDTVTFTVPPNDNSPPTVSISPPYVEANEGDLVQLECLVSGNPLPRITWRRASNQALPYSSQLSENVLRIDSARTSDSGEYRCVASNAVGTVESTAMVVVTRRPAQLAPIYLTISPSQPNVQEGQSTQIVCAASKDIPNDALYWTMGGTDTLPANTRSYSGVLYIDGATIENTGVYVCQSGRPEYAINPVQVALNVQLLQPTTLAPGDEPGLLLSTNTTTIPTGESRTVECIPLGYPQPIIKWRKYEGEFRSGVSQRGNALVISEAEDSDSGYYVCEAVRADGSPITLSYLSVIIERRERPQMDIWPTGVYPVTLGSTAELRCRILSGDPEPVVTWGRRPSRPLSPNAQLLPENILRISNISVNDDGEYVCTGSNIAGESSVTTSLSVQSPPRITITPQNSIQVVVGQPIRVDCRANGYPEPTVFWRKETPESRELSAPTPAIASIRVSSANVQDEGAYTCIAQSAAGNTQDQVYITVETSDYPNPNEGSGDPEPSPNYDPRPQPEPFYVAEGNNFDLKCNATGPGSDVVVRWSRADGLPLQPNHVRNGNTLYLYRVTSQDSGIYQCTGVDRRTGNDIFASQTMLVVQRPPRITLRPATQVVRPGQYANVECGVDGDQPLNITWTSNSGRFSPRVDVRVPYLRFNRIEVEDAGKYTCIVRNNVGEARGEAEVKVTEPVKLTANVVIERPNGPETVGNNVTVTCRTASNTLQLSWERPGLNQYVSSRPYPGQSVLDIPSVQLADAGVYRCRGQSQYEQTVTDEFTLYVVPAPVTMRPRPPQSEPMVFMSPLGSTQVRMPCTNDLRQSTVEWRREYGSLPSYVNPREPDLRLYNISEADAGTYICRVNSEDQVLEVPVVLQVTHVVPKFQGMSWLSLKPLPPSDIFNKLAFELSIKPQAADGLILYNSDNAGRTGDMIALRLVDAVPEFQFNAGSGMMKLKGDRPLELNKWHNIRVNRNSEKLMMTVDNNGPFVSDYGNPYQGLELKERIYIGGVPDYHQLPDSLTDTTAKGFIGCVSMLILGREEVSLMRDRLEDSGDLAECDTCTPDPCRNSGICQEAQNERGYTCLCPAGFAGPNCSRVGESCHPGLCGPGKCRDTEDSYICSCPITHTGRRCEILQAVEYPAFTGSAYLAFDPPATLRTLKLSMKIKAASPVSNGIIMYCSESAQGINGFTSLAVRNGYLEFRYDIGENTGPVVLTYKRPLQPYEWTEVLINRQALQISMTIDGIETVTGVLPRSSGRKQMRWNTPMYVGGYDDKEVVLNNNTGVTGGFNGCIKDLKVRGVPMDIVQAIQSANVQECSNVGPQRGDIPADDSTTSPIETSEECPCRNGGQCRAGGACACAPGYYGTYCESRQTDNCDAQPCRSGGTCRPTAQGHECDCPLGFSGYNCQTNVRIQQNVMFAGSGHMVLPSYLMNHQSPPQTAALRLSTPNDGVILFQHSMYTLPADNGDFLLLHVKQGLATLEWAVGSGVSSVVNPTHIADGKKHVIVLKVNEGLATLEVDGTLVSNRASGMATMLDADSEIYLGGIPRELNWLGLPGFRGCFEQVEFTDYSSAIDLGEVAESAVNADRCWGREMSFGNFMYWDEFDPYDAPPSLHVPFPRSKYNDSPPSTSHLGLTSSLMLIPSFFPLLTAFAVLPSYLLCFMLTMDSLGKYGNAFIELFFDTSMNIDVG